jgi:Ca2+-transporting ATPase
VQPDIDIRSPAFERRRRASPAGDDGEAAPSLGRVLARSRDAARGALRFVREGIRRGEGRGDLPADDGEAAPEPAFHAWELAAVARALGVDPQRGLDEAQVAERRREYGPNVLAGIEPRSTAQIVAGQVLTVPTAILAAAAGASAMLGDLLEAAAIAGVVGINVSIGTFTERRAEELLHAWGELRAERARVLRCGREATIRAADVVPGDVLVLGPGDAVAADARVAAADGLFADESTLTGESEPADKRPEPDPEDAVLADRSSMVYAGTVIASGSGRAIVAATGERTELGKIRRALSSADERIAPLEQQLDLLGKRLAGLAAASAGAVVAIGLLRGRAPGEVLKSAVALGVAAIPEGIPTAGTTALALASRKLHRRGIVIRKLAAAETLGEVSVVCADKTGTLTLNRMRVEELFVPGEGRVEVAWCELDGRARMTLRRGDGSELDPRAVRDLARVAALNADVELGDDGAVRRGSGTERALVEFALGAGFPAPAQRRRSRRVREERRSAEHSFMVTVHDDPELGRIELVKGAPEQVIEMCDLPERSLEALRRNEEMAGRGLRVLACAWRPRPPENGERLVFLGLVGLRDPPREGVRGTIAALRRAGVRTTMLTGDQHRTAQAIARELGIDEDAVYSRVTPEAKVDVVRDLQGRGQIVAMTGDGVNDAPALRAADVGVAMGQRGTDIARAVADVVLARDDLTAIAEAVAEGRRLHDNVQRAIDYLVATNMSEVAVMIAGALAGASPLTPLELLWLNMLTDVVPALALALEPAGEDVMRRPPRDPRAPLFGPSDYRRLGRHAAGMAAASLGAYAIGALRRRRGASPAAMAFTALGAAQLLHTGACRVSARSTNPSLDRALAGSFAIQLAAVTSRPLRRALGVGATSPADLGIAALLGALPALRRALRRRASWSPGDIIVLRSPRALHERPEPFHEEESVR